MAAQPTAFWQDAHNHPLPLIYTGDRCVFFVKLLTESFGVDRTFKLSTTDLSEVMNELMPIHFKNNDKEYFAYCNVPNGVFIAFNHLFHDALSIGKLLQNEPLRSCYISPIMKKIPHDSTSPPLDYNPVKVTSISINQSKMNLLKNTYKMTRNEVAFMLTCGIISRQRQDEKLMCLHNMRKCLHEEGGCTGGDFTCSSIPLNISSEIVNNRETFPDTVKNHFIGIKSGALIPEEIDPTDKKWVFDTWIGSSLGQPGVQPSDKFQLMLPPLMEMFSVVCRNFIVVADIGDEVILNFFANEFNADEADVDIWLPTI